MLLEAIALLAMQAGPNPLAPAHKGMVQCRGPNEERKTCLTIVAYTPQGKGSYRSVSRSRLRNQPDIIIEAVATVHVENGLVCDHDLAATWRGARVTLGVGGPPAPEGIATDVHGWVDQTFTQYEGKRVCSRYEDAAHGVTSVLLIDGVPDPEDVGGEILWVRPEDYRLAPVPGATTKKR